MSYGQAQGDHKHQSANAGLFSPEQTHNHLEDTARYYTTELHCVRPNGGRTCNFILLLP